MGLSQQREREERYKRCQGYKPWVFFIKRCVEMKIKFIILCLLIIINFDSVCLAETLEPGMVNASGSSANSSNISSDKTDYSAESKKNLHLEVGGNINWLNNDYGQWKAFDISLKYSGLKKFTPMVSLSRQTRKEGSQFVYGLGSYINVNSKFYMIAGISGAPVRDPDVILYPRLRLDLSGYVNAPIIDGLVLSAGITHLPKQNGAGGDIISVGGIYYGKVIFTGSLNYNIAQPGSVTSLSGQGGFMYGTQGKYWIGGGIAMGRVAYQMVSKIPLDVRYKSRGAHLFYSRWLGKNWGINNRLDYQNQVGFYKLIGIKTSLFFDF